MCALSMRRPMSTSRYAIRARSRRPWLALSQPIQYLPRDVEIPGAAAEANSWFDVTMKVRPAGHAQIEFPRQPQILLNIGRPVIAVIHLDRIQSRLSHLSH